MNRDKVSPKPAVQSGSKPKQQRSRQSRSRPQPSNPKSPSNDSPTVSDKERSDPTAGAIREFGDETTAANKRQLWLPGDLSEDHDVPPEWVPVPASKVVGKEERDWLWKGYASRGLITLLSGHPKAGKTTLLTHLLRELGQGGELAGSEISPGKVLVVTEESSGLWHDRIRELQIGDHVAFIVFPFKGKPDHDEWEEFVIYLALLVAETETSLVVIDTFAAVNPANDENASAEMMRVLTPLRQLKAVAVLLTHHLRKGDGTQGQAARGSNALAGFVDIILELRRVDGRCDSNRRVLNALARTPAPPDVVIELEDGAYRCLGSREAASQSERVKAIRTILGEHGVPIGVEAIIKAWPPKNGSPSKRTIEGDLKLGAETEKWIRTGEGKKGSPFQYSINAIPAPIDTKDA